MAAPDLNSPASVKGKAAFLALADTNSTTLLTNAVSSGKALRVSSLMLCNVDGTNSVDASVDVYSAATGGTGYALASTISVPADSTVVVISRDNPVYLEEDRRIEVQASAGGDLEVVCSYEEVA